MHQVIRRTWDWLSDLTRRTDVLFVPALSAMNAIVRQPIARCRLAIVVALILVCAYAAGVISYVMLTPDIGVRCAFTPVVNHFNPEFLFQENAEPLQGDDTIVQLGDQKVSNWAQILHVLVDLRRTEGESGTEADLSPTSKKTHLIVKGEEIIRVRYHRVDDPPVGDPQEKIRTVWLRVGRPPLETLAPSLLWFLLKIGLFVVGAIVFWKRPQDRSASQFFLFCLVSFGAYMGGYHWWRIVTQPTLLLVFIVCSVLLPAVSLHFYLVFPRPKAILDRAPQRVLLLLYGPPVFFLLLLISRYFRIRWRYQHGLDVGPPLDEMLFEIYCYFGVAALWYLASVVCLVHSYRTAVGADRAQSGQVDSVRYAGLAGPDRLFALSRPGRAPTLRRRSGDLADVLRFGLCDGRLHHQYHALPPDAAGPTN